MADGYPKIGPEDCRSHVAYVVNGTDVEVSSKRGFVDVGCGLGQLLLGTTKAFHFHMPIPEAETETYNNNDCIDGSVDYLTDSYSSTAGGDGIDITAHRDGEAVWGDLEGDFCNPLRTVNINGNVSTVYECVSVTAKFAAFVDESDCDPACAGTAPAESGGDCEMSTCRAGVCQAGATTCPRTSLTCQP